jgi:hypothetical protein
VWGTTEELTYVFINYDNPDLNYIKNAIHTFTTTRSVPRWYHIESRGIAGKCTQIESSRGSLGNHEGGVIDRCYVPVAYLRNP